MQQKSVFYLLGRPILNSYILYCNKIPTTRKSFIMDYQQTRIRPGRKATGVSKRLLNPEAHMKQIKLPKGKKINCVICTNLKQNKQALTSYVCDECGVALCIRQCWEKYRTKKAL